MIPQQPMPTPPATAPVTPAPPVAAAPPKPLRRKPIFTPYVVVWSIFGVLSAGYIMLMGLAPELIDDLTPASGFTADPQSNQGQRAAARLASDVSGLRDSIKQVQLDLARVRTDVASHDERDKAMSAQLLALEKKLDTQGSTLDSAARTPAPAEPRSQETATPVPDTNVEVRADAVQSQQIATPPKAASAPAQPKVINAAADAIPGALVTGSVVDPPAKIAATPAKAAEPINFGPAVVKPAPKPLAIQLSSGASVDSLRLSWSLLSDRHGDTLKNLQARYVTNGDAANPNFDLIAGPIKTKAEAQRVCKALSSKGVPCSIGDFKGDAL